MNLFSMSALKSTHCCTFKPRSRGSHDCTVIRLRAKTRINIVIIIIFDIMIILIWWNIVLTHQEQEEWLRTYQKYSIKQHVLSQTQSKSSEPTSCSQEVARSLRWLLNRERLSDATSKSIQVESTRCVFRRRKITNAAKYMPKHGIVSINWDKK